jgi:hypothetical protein
MNRYRSSRRSVTTKPFVIATFVSALGMLPLTAPAELIVVSNTSDTDLRGCELRSAIDSANSDSAVGGCTAGSGVDTIEFSTTGTIILGSNLPTVTEGLVINGPGNDKLAISGANLYQQLYFDAGGASHEIRDLSFISGMNAGPGGCIRTNAGSLLIENVVFSKCLSDSQGGALAAITDTTIRRSQFLSNSGGAGGAVFFSTGNSSISDSTFKSNQCSGPAVNSGGAVQVASSASVTVERSTFQDNRAKMNGGALAVVSTNATLTINSSTITQNHADSDGNSTGNGGGISVDPGTLNISNSIVAGNIDHNNDFGYAPDIEVVAPATASTGGYNAVGINTGADSFFPAGNPNGSSDYAGTSIKPITVELESIGNFGGPTPTMPPTAESFAIDRGNCPSELADQRGYSDDETGFRVVDLLPANAADGCDIGAVEMPLARNGVFRDGFETD